MKQHNLLVFVALLGSVVLPFAGTQEAQSANRPAVSTYAPLDKLPDWHGWWAATESVMADFWRNPPPMRQPELLAKMQAASLDPKAAPDPGKYCRPQQFTGALTAYAPNVEFLFTPGRVTITNEIGLIRRIYVDGTGFPADVIESDTGTSVGHWEGRTLVVETTGISPTAKFPFLFTAAAVAIGQNARTTERFTLTADTLNVDLVLSAPDILKAQYHRTHAFRRVPGKVRAQEMATCFDNDRAYDAATGTQRFDMTPPADLPPPPSH
jgi:hypothetical protein